MSIRKYRYWVIGAKLMVGWNVVKSYTMAMILDNPSVIPMAFTGLLDKNGKEIYEGDILGSDAPSRVGIEWHEGGFGFWFNKEKPWKQWVSLSGHGYLDMILKDCEVIGNIYEHGHLLAPTESKDGSGT
jgi:hypothetical protein